MSLQNLSAKKIFLSNEFISYSSSLLHLPIFTSLHSKTDNAKSYIFEVDRYWGFEDVSISAPWLSIKWDFTVFTYILRKYYKGLNNGKCELEKDYTIKFSIDDFLVENEVKTNKLYYIDQIKSSIEKLSKITIHFTKSNKRYYCRILSPSANGVLFDTKQLTGSIDLTIDKHFINFFNHDPDLILNIDQKEFGSINGDYPKILYTFYKTNQQTKTFEKEIIIQRLRPDSAKTDYRRIFDSIKNAHKELIKCGFIKEVKYKKMLNTKEISHFEIILNDDYILKKKEIKKEEKKEEKKRPSIFDKKKDDGIPF